LVLYDELHPNSNSNTSNISNKSNKSDNNKSGLYSTLSDYYRNEANTYSSTSHTTSTITTTTSANKPCISFLQTHFPFHHSQNVLLLYSSRYISPVTSYFLMEENVYMFQEDNAMIAMQKLLTNNTNTNNNNSLYFPLSICIDVIKECCDFTWNYNQENYLDMLSSSSSSSSSQSSQSQQHRNENINVKKGHTIARQNNLFNFLSNKLVLETILIKYQQSQPSITSATSTSSSEMMIGVQAIYQTLVKCGFQLGTLDTRCYAITNHEWISLHKVIFLLQVEWKYRQIMHNNNKNDNNKIHYVWRDQLTIPQALVSELFHTTTAAAAAATATGSSSATAGASFYNRKEVLYRFYLELCQYNPDCVIKFMV